VSWDAVTDEGEAGLSHYAIAVDGEPSQESLPDTTSASVTDLDAATTYEIAVRAVDGAGNESALATVIAETIATDAEQSPFNGPHTILGGSRPKTSTRAARVSPTTTLRRRTRAAPTTATPRSMSVPRPTRGTTSATSTPASGWSTPSRSTRATRCSPTSTPRPARAAVAPSDRRGRRDRRHPGRLADRWLVELGGDPRRQPRPASGRAHRRVTAEAGAWNFDWIEFGDGNGGTGPRPRQKRRRKLRRRRRLKLRRRRRLRRRLRPRLKRKLRPMTRPRGRWWSTTTTGPVGRPTGTTSVSGAGRLVRERRRRGFRRRPGPGVRQRRLVPGADQSGRERVLLAGP